MSNAAVTTIAAPSAEQGKLFAALSWGLNIIGLPFWLVPVIQKNNAFALYHAKQAMFLWLAMFAFSIVMTILSVVVGMVAGVLANLLLIPMMAVGGAGLVMNILGVINAINLREQPVPFIGEKALNVFKGITAKNA